MLNDNHNDDSFNLESLLISEEELHTRAVLDTMVPPPNPQTSHQSPTDLVDIFVKACPEDLRELVQDFIASSKSATARDVKVAFGEFQSTDKELTKKPAEYLVCPSGSLDNVMGLKLRYPTFSTSHPSMGESADWTNPCTRLLLKKGLSSKQCLWYEAFFRREPAARDRSDPMKHWSTNERQVHQEFSEWVENRSTMKVLLLFGKWNRDELLRSSKDMVTILVRVSTGITITATIVFEGEDISRIVVYCPHPEYYYHDYSIASGEWLDAAINLAAALVGIEDLDIDFFTRRTRYFTNTRLDLITDKPAQGWYGFLRVAHDELEVERISGKVLLFHDLSPDILGWMQAEFGSSTRYTAEHIGADRKDSILTSIVKYLASKGGEAARPANEKRKAAAEAKLRTPKQKKNRAPKTNREAWKPGEVILSLRARRAAEAYLME